MACGGARPSSRNQPFRICQVTECNRKADSIELTRLLRFYLLLIAQLNRLRVSPKTSHQPTT